MQKIPTMFERDWNGDRSRVLNQIHEGCEWVLAGEGVATRKLDGTCCMIRNGKLYKRRELRKGDVTPSDFEEVSFDEETEKRIGWLPVDDADPQDKWHREGFAALENKADGTYELVGPHVQKNLEGYEKETLVPHTLSLAFAEQPPRDYEGIKAWLVDKNVEGIVFHHPDGRRAKIKKRDFGLKR